MYQTHTRAHMFAHTHTHTHTYTHTFLPFLPSLFFCLFFLPLLCHVDAQKHFIPHSFPPANVATFSSLHVFLSFSFFLSQESLSLCFSLSLSLSLSVYVCVFVSCCPFLCLCLCAAGSRLSVPVTHTHTHFLSLSEWRSNCFHKNFNGTWKSAIATAVHRQREFSFHIS